MTKRLRTKQFLVIQKGFHFRFKLFHSRLSLVKYSFAAPSVREEEKEKKMENTVEYIKKIVMNSTPFQ